MGQTKYDATCPACGGSIEVWVPAKNYTFETMAGPTHDDALEWLEANQEEIVQGEGAAAISRKKYQKDRTFCESCNDHVHHIERCTDL